MICATDTFGKKKVVIAASINGGVGGGAKYHEDQHYGNGFGVKRKGSLVLCSHDMAVGNTLFKAWLLYFYIFDQKKGT